MKIALAFPPSICLPNQLYLSVPQLMGVAARAGHSVSGVDLNLAAADMLLDDARAERYLGMAHDLVARSRAAGDPGAGAMADALAVSEPKVRAGQSCKQLLRDPVRGYDQAAYKRSYWTVVDALSFYYQLDPIVSPFRESFARDMVELLEADAWTPLSDLYEEGLVDEVLAHDPDVVGLSAAFPEQTVETFRLARRLRARRPDLHLALGGPLLNLHPERWFEAGWIFSYFDSVCFGDGAHCLVELLEALDGQRGMETVTNLVWRDSRATLVRNTPEPFLEPLDELPPPDFHTLDMQRYFTPRPIYPMMLSRGCYWGRCTFCSIGWRENYRMVGREKLRADALDLVNEYGARYVQVQDSSVPPRGAHELSQVIAEEQLELYWVGGLKFTHQLMDRAWCQTLAAGGCRSLLMGFESANQRVLDAMDKGFCFDDAAQMLTNLRDAGISAELLWFIGFPTETRADILRTVRWLTEHSQLYGLTAFVGDYQLHPDTIVFDQPERFGVTVLGHSNGYCRYVAEMGVQQDELAQLKRMLACTNNRTMICNASHLPHLVESGLDLSLLERPMVVPPEVVAYCEAAVPG